MNMFYINQWVYSFSFAQGELKNKTSKNGRMQLINWRIQSVMTFITCWNHASSVVSIFFLQMAHVQLIYPSRNLQTTQGILIPLDCELLKPDFCHRCLFLLHRTIGLQSSMTANHSCTFVRIEKSIWVAAAAISLQGETSIKQHISEMSTERATSCQNTIA